MSIEELLDQWDGESLVLQRDKATGATFIIAIHSTRLGIPSGGTRMKPYPNLAAAVLDAMRLSEGMTMKFAAAGLTRGGAKGVIALPATFDTAARGDLLRQYGRLIKQLGGLFETGPDVGTSPADMDIIAETGFPHVFAKTVANGGAGDSGGATALGIYSGIKALCNHLWGTPSPARRRVLVQGAGSVGGKLIDLLVEAEAEVLFSDVAAAAVAKYREERGLTFVPPEAVFMTECDIFVPCALGGVLTAETIPLLRCAAVAGGANNQLGEAADADRLAARGIVYVPDYVMNVGGAMFVLGVELGGMTQAEGEAYVAAVGDAVAMILQRAAAEGITPVAAAEKLALARLAEKG